MKSKIITEKGKVWDFLRERKIFFQCKTLRRKMTWMGYSKDGNALKRSRDETNNEIKTLQKTSLSLEEKRAKM